LTEHTADQLPPDHRERERITNELSSTLFVEAGAGSGKTSALVERVLALVASGEAELSEIAAITFSEKAAGELRDRIRQKLEEEAADDYSSLRSQRCRAALNQLDAAAVGTLHAFAQRILTEHPIEAGLPPHLEVLDEVSAAIAFDERWSSFLDSLLGDTRLERALVFLFAAGVRSDALRALAIVFDDNWDLVDAHITHACEEPPALRPLLADGIRRAREACAAPCSDPGDRLAQRLGEISDCLDELERIEDEAELLERISEEASRFRVGNLGTKKAFGDVKAVREQVAEAGAALDEARATVLAASVRQVASALRAFTLASAEERRRSGTLTFHDLLVRARRLLTDPVHGPTVRARLHKRYRRLLLDEFQDTDPIQVELAVRIAADDPLAEASGSAPWHEVPVTDGQLFFVGDPKQSIYRFRRADIATFLNAAQRFGSSSGGHVTLTANFRACAPIIEWVNRTFASLMGEDDEIEVPVPSQPSYVGLQALRPAPPVGPAVAVLAKAAHRERHDAEALRAREAEDVVAAVSAAIGEGWSISDGAGQWRQARLGDIAVLIPTRTSLPALEEAFEDAGIAFYSEASSLVYSARPVRDLLMVLRAVDDPSNTLQLVAALRTPLLACGDDDLFRFRRERRGRFDLFAAQPASVPDDDPVRAGLAYLASLHEARHTTTPSGLLARIVEERRALELGFAEGRPRDLWRQVRFIIDQARAFCDAGGGSLRQYLGWVDRQAADDVRVAEAVLPETDDDAVRILTIHAAKGLEFPITIVSGMTSAPRGHAARVEVCFSHDGAVGYRFGAKVRTQEHARLEPVNAQMELHERIRLLYVACTRARDHLIVSLHRNLRSSPPASTRRTGAELLVDGMGEALDDLAELASSNERSGSASTRPAIEPPAFETWLAERQAILAKASRSSVVAAGALNDDGGFEPGDTWQVAQPPLVDVASSKRASWQTGAPRTAIGRAVHGVLSAVDLASGEELEALVEHHCAAEAIHGHASEVERLVRAALAAPSVMDAARTEHWRELYVCAPVGERLLEGYVDLLYRSQEGLVLIDYKTTALTERDQLERLVAHYEAQGAAYALALETAVCEPVAKVRFVFLTLDGAIERDIDDLPAARQRVRAQLVAGDEVALS
jgi:ATP-dependent helicase/nuclease subunit A